jgi:GNAT superfamily N-acetyltransferase
LPCFLSTPLASARDDNDDVITVVPAEGAVLDRLLDATHAIWHEGLSRQAYGRYHAAQMRTAWGRDHQQWFALIDGSELLASAKRYRVAGILDQRPVRICGIGAVFTEPMHRGHGYARTLVERLHDEATHEGAEVGLLFSALDATWCDRNGFEKVPLSEVELGVAQSPRHGAPMTLVRGGEARDLAAIVAMGQVRAAPFRFHLDRDADFVQYAITKKRLLAGLGSPGARQVQFFIAEEGITAAAYVVLHVVGRTWTIEECGDRDPGGARVGAILQALIAREPVERRPSIRGCLPPGFVPPQITIVSAKSSLEVMRVRWLGATPVRPRLSSEDVLYWQSDVF